MIANGFAILVLALCGGLLGLWQGGVQPEEQGLTQSKPVQFEPVQFERQGYFVRDVDSTPDRPVFNRTVGLRDTFAKEVGGKK